MSSPQPPKGVKEVIGRALVDKDYREQLYKDPDTALQGYTLTADERDALKSMDKPTLDAQAARVAAGKSSAIVIGEVPPANS